MFEPKFSSESFKISSISFLSGKVICTDKAKTELYCPYTIMKRLANDASEHRYFYFKLDGKVIVDYKLHDYKDY